MAVETEGTRSTVSYRIGVQNRYSAFLDSDDNGGFATVSASLGAQPKPKQQKPANGKSVAKQGATKKLEQRNVIGAVNRPLVAASKNNLHKEPAEGDARVGLKHQRVYTRSRQEGNQGEPQQNCVVVRYTRNRAAGQQPLNQQQTGNQQDRPQRNSRFTQETYQRNGNKKQFQDNATASAHLVNGNKINGTLTSSVNNNDKTTQLPRGRAQFELKHKSSEKNEVNRQPRLNGSDKSNSPGNGDDGSLQPRFSQPRKNNISSAKPADQEENSTRDTRRSAQGKPRRINPDTNGSSVAGRSKADASPSNQSAQNNGRNFQKPQKRSNGYVPKNAGSGASKTLEQQSTVSKKSVQQEPVPNFSNKLDFPTLGE